MNIFNALEYGKEHFPDKEAIVFDGRTIPYHELHAQACRLSALFGEVARVERGDRVALFLPNGPEFVAAYYAAMHCGAIAVSLNVMLKHDEVKFIIDDCEAKVLVTSSALLDQVPQSGALAALKKILCVDKSTRADAFALDQFSALECASTESAEMGHGDGAAILYTSGTTGKPKGALLSHGNVISNIRAVRRHTQMSSDDRLICYLPMFHCFGQNFIMNAGLDAGASLIIHERFQPEEILASLNVNRVTMFFGVPPVYQKLLTMPETEAAFSHVRYCFTAAAPMPVRIAQQWQQQIGQVVYEGYGLTETAPFASYNHASLYREGSVGTPIENVEIKIADARGNALPPGETGEIAIKGPNVMLGYFRRPKDTEAAIRDGWFFTGDIGREDEDGYIYLVDRAKDMINVAGYKVWPREVEDTLMQHPSIADVAVIGITDEESGEAVKAFVVAKPGAAISEQEIIEFARTRMAAYKAPRAVEMIDALPRNPAGKVLKRELRERSPQFNRLTVQPLNVDLAHPDERLNP